MFMYLGAYICNVRNVPTGTELFCSLDVLGPIKLELFINFLEGARERSQ